MARNPFQFIHQIPELWKSGEKENRSRVRWMVIGFVVLLTFLFLFGGSYGVIRLLRLKIEKRRLMADIRTLEHKQDSLKQTIERIQKDPAEIERIAREHYGMAKPGEKVFKFVSPAERKSNPAKPE